MEKREIIEEIAKLIESDPNSTPMNLDILEFMSEEELESIKDSLIKSKASRSEENDKWFDELVSK